MSEKITLPLSTSQVHDAYIECGEILSKTDPLLAVDVYCKFPVSETPTFDDAYIVGDVVRHLMKAEKFDDPRLQSNLISMGRVLGIGEVSNQHSFLFISNSFISNSCYSYQ